jgi:hypothetical protein
MVCEHAGGKGFARFVSRKKAKLYTDRLSPRTPRTTRNHQPLAVMLDEHSAIDFI